MEYTRGGGGGGSKAINDSFEGVIRVTRRMYTL